MSANAPGHVWRSDITYVRLRSGWLYLVAILDWYPRYVVNAEYKGLVAVIVQDLELRTDNVRFLKEKWYARTD